MRHLRYAATEGLQETNLTAKGRIRMHRSGRRLWKLGWVPLLLAWWALQVPAQGAASPPPASDEAPPSGEASSSGTTFSGKTSVTAADVVVELTRKQTLFTGSDLPETLRPDDFTVFYDGIEVPVVGLEAPGDQAEAWQLVIYADAGQLQADELAWAARLLGPRLEELLALGAVSIVLADPQPHVLAAGRESDLLGGALARLELFAEQTLGDASLPVLALRRELLEVLSDPELNRKLDAEDLTREELISAVRTEEARLVDESLQNFRDYLLDLDPPTARRAVLWLGQGIDAYPSDFYGNLYGPQTGLDSEGSRVDDDLNDFATEHIEPVLRTLAAHGWTVLSFLPPPPDDRAGLRRGWRLGKWRLRGLGATYEEDRDPERASAYLDLGHSLEGQSKPADAVEAYERAIFHYAGDPRTSALQARAYRRLETLYEAAGDDAAALEAGDYAQILEAEAARRGAATGGAEAEVTSAAYAERFDPWPVAELAADLSAGWVVATPGHLQQALASLRRRVRLTYQVPGRPTQKHSAPVGAPRTGPDALIPIEVETSRGGLLLRAPVAARPAPQVPH